MLNGERGKAIGYCRVSTIGQSIDGVSLDAQKGKIEAWGQLHNYDVVVLVETQSGKRADNRPVLQKTIDRACRDRVPLVFYSLSRVSRNTREMIEIAERLEKNGADMVSLSENIDTSSASGKMVFRLLAVLAEFERDVISERTRTALAHIRANGGIIGGTSPYGFKHDNGKIVKDPKEQKNLSIIRGLHERGLTYREIQDELRKRKVLNRRGKSDWNLAVLSRILKAKGKCIPAMA